MRAKELPVSPRIDILPLSLLWVVHLSRLQCPGVVSPVGQPRLLLVLRLRSTHPYANLCLTPLRGHSPLGF